jgi:hypothetical protein
MSNTDLRELAAAMGADIAREEAATSKPRYLQLGAPFWQGAGFTLIAFAPGAGPGEAKVLLVLLAFVSFRFAYLAEQFELALQELKSRHALLETLLSVLPGELHHALGQVKAPAEEV